MAKRKSNKMDAVRKTLTELGNDAKPRAIQEHLKSQGVTMSTNMISNYKTVIRKKTGKRGRPRGKRLVIRKTTVGRGSGGGISLADIQTVKKLTDRIGADKVKELATVLAN